MAAGTATATREQELIARVLNGGDTVAEAAFVRYFGRYVNSVLHRNQIVGAEREDLFQEVFLRLWEQDKRRLRLWQCRGNGKFTSFLAVLTTRLALDQHRRSNGENRATMPSWRQSATESSDGEWEGHFRPHAEDCLPAAPESLPELCHFRDQIRVIRAVLPQMSSRDMTLLTLRYLEEESYRAIAERLGLTVNHVGVALARAEARLRQRLTQYHPDLFAEEAAAPVP